MTALAWLIPAALLLSGLGLAFLWSLKSGQFEDLEGAAWRAAGRPRKRAASRRGQEGAESGDEKSRPAFVGGGVSRAPPTNASSAYLSGAASARRPNRSAKSKR